jgi:nitrilase
VSATADRVRVAVVQEPPAVLDLEEGVRRAVAHVSAAAREGAQLVAFSETWLTGYPAWIFGLAAWDDAEARHWYGRLLEQCPTVDAPALDPLRRAAAAHEVVVVLGLNERARTGSGTLWNSLLYLGRSGETLGVHRKLTPTHTERIVWAPAQDARGLRVHETPVGRLGGLVCWEHWSPLARQAMHLQDEQIHLAAWPDMTDMHALTSRTYAFEGRCHVLAAAQYLTAEDVPDEVRDAYRAGVGPGTPASGVWFPGGSAVVGPDGQWVAGPLEGRAGTVHAELDLAAALGYKHDLDVAGHYARPDVFSLTVDRRPRAPVSWLDAVAGEDAAGKGASRAVPDTGGDVPRLHAAPGS